MRHVFGIISPMKSLNINRGKKSRIKEIHNLYRPQGLNEFEISIYIVCHIVNMFLVSNINCMSAITSGFFLTLEKLVIFFTTI